MKQILFAVAGLCAASCFAITPNANLSIGKNLYVDGAVNSNWKPEVYTDGSLDFNQITSVSDFALNVGEGPSKIFITWETRGDGAWLGDNFVHAASCQHMPQYNESLHHFKVMTSANSTNGADGDWETVAEVGESGAMSRGLAIDFAGKSWFRIVAEKPVTNLQEVGAYDMSDGGNDTWFFMGTSISQMGIKTIDVDSNFAQLIHARYPDYYPVMLRGGIGCVNTDGVVDGLKYYGEYAGNVKYWAIEMGTNDAWGDETGWNVDHFKENMQQIIDTAKAHGVTPIIARMIATNPEVAKWQVYKGYQDVIDELTEKNNLPKGPDFFEYFSKHPEELSSGDGVHPAEKGAQSMHRLWAEAVAPLYKAGVTDEDKQQAEKPEENPEEKPAAVKLSARFAMPKVSLNGREIFVGGVSQNMQVSLVNVVGQVVELHNVRGNESFTTNVPSGNYLLVIRSAGRAMTMRVSVK